MSEIDERIKRIDDLKPLARQAWPHIDDSWRRQLMSLMLEALEFKGGDPDRAHMALEAALEVMATGRPA